jgi:uncharacterized protein (TIGR02145 family)
MKNFLTILMLCGFMGSYAQNTPRYAASTQTWVFGDQTWSDAIHIPDCNKNSFTNSDTEPQCRSYTDGRSIWYYYNWTYVNQHADTLCPSPWHFPSKPDFSNLINNTTHFDLISAWGYGGYASGTSLFDSGSSIHVVSTYAYYWSSSESSAARAYDLYFTMDDNAISQHYLNKCHGFRVRCVK